MSDKKTVTEFKGRFESLLERIEKSNDDQMSSCPKWEIWRLVESEMMLRVDISDALKKIDTKRVYLRDDALENGNATKAAITLGIDYACETLLDLLRK